MKSTLRWRVLSLILVIAMIVQSGTFGFGHRGGTRDR